MRFSSYFRSEFHFRGETFTVNRETPFLRLLAFLSRLSWALAYLPEYRRYYFCGLSGLIKLFGFNRKRIPTPTTITRSAQKRW